MATPDNKPRVLPDVVKAFAIVKDGFLPGFIPAFRVVTVTTDDKGRAQVESSKQKYVIGEAQAMVEDLLRESLGI